MSSTPPAPPSLWDFSVQLYGQPGVADACLSLQEQHGLDVNLLLFGIWSDLFGNGGLDLEAFERITREASAWRDQVIIPTREARRAAKRGHPSLTASESEAVYRRMLDTELALEKTEQTIIERIAADAANVRPVVASEPGAPSRFLDWYLDDARVIATQEVCQSLETIASKSRAFGKFRLDQ